MLNSKERKVRVIALLLVLGVAYALIVRYTSFGIPCFFQRATGMKCPGCGITHLFMCLMDFDLYGACRANYFLFVTAPVFVLIFFLDKFCGSKSFVKWFSVFYLILLLIWGIVRNFLQI